VYVFLLGCIFLLSDGGTGFLVKIGLVCCWYGRGKLFNYCLKVYVVWGLMWEVCCFSVDFDGFDVFWDGHASVRVVDDGFSVCVDPYSQVCEEGVTADIVLVTHSDLGHFDSDALESVRNGKTVFVFPDSFEEEGVDLRDTEFLSEGEVIDVYGVEIEAVPMYDENHERGEGVGYRFTVNGTSFYVPGDTGVIDEMRDLENRVDLGFFPVDGEFTMGVSEAVRAAVRVKPGVAVPYHYGEPFFPDKDVNAKEFKAELEDRNIECRVLDPTSPGD
jgi:L-ascorbate metabolism protein UlaG (beta-lactamase superfamily)